MFKTFSHKLWSLGTRGDISFRRSREPCGVRKYLICECVLYENEVYKKNTCQILTMKVLCKYELFMLIVKATVE